jgi:hypothetical protein
VVSFTPRPLYPLGKSLRYVLDRRLGGPQSRFEAGGEEKKSLPLPGTDRQSMTNGLRLRHVHKKLHEYQSSGLNVKGDRHSDIITQSHFSLYRKKGVTQI